MMAANLRIGEERDLAPQLEVAPPSSQIAAQIDHLEPANSSSPEEHASDQVVESRTQTIARAAYFLAEARGFEPGRELDDWLAAEQQMSSQ